jgi:isopenicillin-N N-acyltransferase-like protein
VRAECPDVLGEVLAMADAAGIDRDEAVAAQLVDETWLVGRSHGVPEHCSTVGLHEGDRTAIGQNMDLEPFRHGHQLAVRHRRPDAPDLLLLASPGVIAFNGVNAAGVAVCVNALGELGGRSEGLPVAFVIRALLDRSTATEAAAFVAAVPHASGQHYLVADRHGLHSHECGPDGTTELPADRLLLHTNHVLAGPPEAGRKVPDGTGIVDGLIDSSHARLDSLRLDLGEGASIQDALRSLRDPVHPVCRRFGEGDHFTFASTVFDLDERPRMHVTAGPPDEHPAASLAFD